MDGSAAARFRRGWDMKWLPSSSSSSGTRGAVSHGESRIIRYTYSDEVYTHMMARHYLLWQELQVQVYSAPAVSLRGQERSALRRHGPRCREWVAHEILDAMRPGIGSSRPAPDRR
jgi:hypothetical protein